MSGVASGTRTWVMNAPLTPHPSAFQVIINFGQTHKGKSLGDLCQSETGKGYLSWIAQCKDFYDPYWPIAAKAALAGLPVPMKSAPKQSQEQGVPIAYIGKPTIARLSDRLLQIRFSRDEALTRLFKEKVDGRFWNQATKAWEAPAFQIRTIVKIFGGPDSVVFDEESRKVYDEEITRRARLDILRKKLDGVLKIPGLVKPLWGYQTVAVQFFLACDGRVLFNHDVGLGKTPMALAAALYKKARTLVVCPASVKIGWERKLRLFADLPATVWEGDKVAGDLSNQFHIVTYEIFVKRKQEFVEQGFDLLIIDECHNFANPKSLRSLSVFGGLEKKKDKKTKQVTKIKHERFNVKWCVMCTATAMNNHPRELFPLLNYLHPARFPSFWDFGMRYGAFPPGNLSGLPSKPMNLSELHERIGDIVLRVTEEDVKSERPKKLPPTDLLVELNAKQRKEYRKLLDSLMGEWEAQGKPTLAAMHVLREWLNEVKLPLVWETIDGLLAANKSVVLFSTRLEPLRKTMLHYEGKAVLIAGELSVKRRQASIDSFSAKESPLAAVSIRAGGTGIDGLQYGGHHAIFLDLDWVPALHHQAEGRLDRTGQTFSVVAYYAMVADSVDEYLREIIERKLALTSEVMDGKVLKLKRRKSVFKEFVQRLKQDYKALAIAEADENEGAADEHLEEVA